MAKEKKKSLASKILKTRPTTLTLKKEKIDRNDPCPCGSGKKYKKCCFQKKQTIVGRVVNMIMKKE